MKNLHIIMPMAGEGLRFVNEGWDIPKPLIKLNDIPLFQRSVKSISTYDIPIKYSFIVRLEHVIQYNIDKEILSLFPDANIFTVEKTTRGAVETCLIAKSAISDDDAIIILDCDLEFKSDEYINEIRKILNNPDSNIDGGVLLSFNSNNPRYSYAKVNEDKMVLMTAEKEVISNHALCGAYFFSSANNFLSASFSLLSEPNINKPEYYISLLYNYLLKEGKSVKLIEIDKYYSYGTPEELKQYL